MQHTKEALRVYHTRLSPPVPPLRVQVRAVSRRRAPPDTLLLGTPLSAFDSARGAWRDGVVAGLSPAGTCVLVAFEPQGSNSGGGKTVRVSVGCVGWGTPRPRLPCVLP
jgi:hypothetical protein